MAVCIASLQKCAVDTGSGVEQVNNPFGLVLLGYQIWGSPHLPLYPSTLLVWLCVMRGTMPYWENSSDVLCLPFRCVTIPL